MKKLLKSKLFVTIFAILFSMCLALGASAAATLYLDFEAAYMNGDHIVDNNVEYQTENMSDGLVPAIDTSKGRLGSTSMKVQINSDTDKSNDRSELVVKDGIPFNTTYYYGFSVYFPADMPTPTDWELFAQTWQMRSYSPPFALELVPNSNPLQFQVVYRNDQVNRGVLYQGNISKGTWNDFVVKANFNGSSPSGALQVWLNGSSVANYTGLLGFTSRNDKDVKFKVGMYRAGSQKISQYYWFDQIRFGASYTDVDPSK